MLILAAVLAVSPATEPSRLDFQLMTSPAYGEFAGKADAACPARRLRYLHPADLDLIEKDFIPSSPRRARHRVGILDRGGRGCTGGGASCTAQQTLAAISQAGALDAFVSFACAYAI